MLNPNEKDLQSKPKAIVVDTETGTSFWQPNNAGYVTINISPWNIVETNHLVFLHELPPGGKINPHSHDNGEEIFICLSGKGLLTLENVEYEFSTEKIAFVGKNVLHSIQNVSEKPLRFVVVMSPPGLEERLKLMGKPKQKGESAPKTFSSNAPLESHGVKRPK